MNKLITLLLIFFVTEGYSQNLKVEVYRYINEYRERNHRKPLKIDEGLEKRAESVVVRIANDGKLTHTKRSQLGECGEILAMLRSQYPTTLVGGWANSPTHNFVMLQKEAKCFGFAFFEKDGFTYYAMWFK